MVLALLIVSLILLLLAAFSLPTGRLNPGWLGLAFFVGHFLIGRL